MNIKVHKPQSKINLSRTKKHSIDGWCGSWTWRPHLLGLLSSKVWDHEACPSPFYDMTTREMTGKSWFIVWDCLFSQKEGRIDWIWIFIAPKFIVPKFIMRFAINARPFKFARQGQGMKTKYSDHPQSLLVQWTPCYDMLMHIFV